MTVSGSDIDCSVINEDHVTKSNIMNNLNGTTIEVGSAVRVLARARAFSNQPIKQHCFSVESDGTVRVFDAVANHYTTCHCLSAASQRRIRKAAKA